MIENWDRLRVFYHVHTCGSISRAAGILNITQPAVSQTISKLEGELDTPLFIRSHKKIIPTPAADRLFSRVQGMMTGILAFEEDQEKTKDGPSGELRIGAPPEFGKIHLTRIASEFRREYPEVTFRLIFGRPERLLKTLQEGGTDLLLLDEFLTRNPAVGSLETFHLEPILQEKVILATSENYFFSRIKGDTSFSSLSRQDFICYRSDQRIVKTWFKKHFPRRQANLRAVLTAGSHEAVVTALKADAGLGVVASHLVSEELESGRLIRIKTSEKDIINTISLVQLLDKVPPLTEKIFIRFMTARLRESASEFTH